MKGRIESRVNYFKSHPAALLLFVQLAMLIILPGLHGTSQSTRLVLAVFSIISILMAIVVVLRSQALNIIGITLGAVSILFTVTSMLPGYETWLACGMILEGTLYLYAAIALIWYMLSDHYVTLDEMFAAGACFTLLGWGFTYAYLALQMFQPLAFTGVRAPGEPRTWIELVFLSFTNLSATGAGDIIPVSPYARLLVIFEQMFGVAYVGVIVSRFMSLTMTGMEKHRARERAARDDHQEI